MNFGPFVVAFVLGVLLQRTTEEVPSFRILAPQFVCPKNKSAVIDQPDNTVITLQTDAVSEMKYTWTVRWNPLVAPTQRFILALWRTVRELEKQLNGPQIEPGVYVINNTELLSGVNYIFNVTATILETDETMDKSFQIDNIQGNQKLLIEGRSNLFSVILVGGQLTYSDLDYVLEAQVTTCYRTQDYYFVWSVTSGDSNVDVSNVQGSRLEINANRLTPGFSYNVQCKVFKRSNGEFITETSIPFRVLHRELNVNFNIDVLVITINTAFDIHTDIWKSDYLQSELEINWKCTLNDELFEDFKMYDVSTLSFSTGLPTVGEYLVFVTVTILGNSLVAHSEARILAVEAQLPIIEVHLTPKVVNKDSFVNLNANISNVTPGCSVIWYFINDECFSHTNKTKSPLCTENEHDIPISEPVYFYSLEENFLSELTDYSNETSFISVAASLQAATGTARVVVKCQCNKIANCSAEGTVYADVKLIVNEKPDAGDILITPETGTAMETMFRISTLAVIDSNRPLRYTFYCELAINDTLNLGTYLEHLAIETLLPHKDGGTSVWVEVCDSLGACSYGTPTIVDIAPGEARTVDALIEDLQALVVRCEIGLLQRLVASTVVTYINAHQTDPYVKFTTILLEALRDIDRNCTERHNDQYNSVLYWLAKTGVDTSGLV